jgi:hypothetical protein
MLTKDETDRMMELLRLETRTADEEAELTALNKKVTEAPLPEVPAGEQPEP